VYKRVRLEPYQGPEGVPAMAGTGPSISWREYVDVLFREFEKRNEQSRALLVSFNDERRAAMEVRLDGLNHLQRRIDALVATLATQPELRLAVERLQSEIQAEVRRLLAEIQAVERRQEVIVSGLNEKIGALQRFQARMAGIGAAGLLLGIAVEFILSFIK
jgi:hypothetical protein